MLAQEGEIEGGFRSFPAVLTSAVTLVEAAYHKDSRVTGVPTALIDLDDKLGGLQRSDLVILAGRPSMGKTALAITIGANAAATRAVGADAEDLAGDNYAVGVFSLEMSAEQLAMRLLSAAGRAELGRSAPRQAARRGFRQGGPGEPGPGRAGRCSSTTPRRSRSRPCARARAGSSGGMACRS